MSKLNGPWRGPDLSVNESISAAVGHHIMQISSGWKKKKRGEGLKVERVDWWQTLGR